MYADQTKGVNGACDSGGSSVLTTGLESLLSVRFLGFDCGSNYADLSPAVAAPMRKKTRIVATRARCGDRHLRNTRRAGLCGDNGAEVDGRGSVDVPSRETGENLRRDFIALPADRGATVHQAFAGIEAAEPKGLECARNDGKLGSTPARVHDRGGSAWVRDENRDAIRQAHSHRRTATFGVVTVRIALAKPPFPTRVMHEDVIAMHLMRNDESPHARSEGFRQTLPSAENNLGQLGGLQRETPHRSRRRERRHTELGKAGNDFDVAER